MNTKQMQRLMEQYRAARRVGVPFISISTPDQWATMKALTAYESEKPIQTADGALDSAYVRWDYVSGLIGLNKAGEAARSQAGDDTVNSPQNLTLAAERMPRGTVLFVVNSQRFLDDVGFVQGVFNLREQYKSSFRTIVLLGPSVVLPAELAGDFVSFDEPLPDEDQVSEIVVGVHEAAGMQPKNVAECSEATTGLTKFQVEQTTAMSLTKKGVNVDDLWERKRKQIEQTQGLHVSREGGTLDDIGGCSNVKNFIRALLAGKDSPSCVVFVDEIEKAFAGSGDSHDSTSKDQLGTILSYMQDQNCQGIICVGPPGAAKSAFAKAAGNEVGIPTISVDLGAAKGSLVGQSEQQLRTMLKVITSVSQGKSLWIATCNSIAELPPELRRRFTCGTFFFDLPDEEERDAIWKIYLKKFGLSGDRPADKGWTGAEIRQCCLLADKLQKPLIDVADFVIPVAQSAADKIEALRKQASGRFISASYRGKYEYRQVEVSSPGAAVFAEGRAMAALED